MPGCRSNLTIYSLAVKLDYKIEQIGPQAPKEVSKVVPNRRHGKTTLLVKCVSRETVAKQIFLGITLY